MSSPRSSPILNAFQRSFCAIKAHAAATDSVWSKSIIEDWEHMRSKFWQVCPKEMLSRLAHPISDNIAIEAAE
jgi:glutamate synthase (NADPH/NADH) large chain